MDHPRLVHQVVIMKTKTIKYLEFCCCSLFVVFLSRQSLLYDVDEIRKFKLYIPSLFGPNE